MCGGAIIFILKGGCEEEANQNHKKTILKLDFFVEKSSLIFLHREIAIRYIFESRL
jgi:hypothetical protein